MINQAIGGNAGGDPSGTAFPVRYRVDYVRQWEWDDQTVPAENCVCVTFNNGAGSAMYELGTKATAAAGQPPVGQIFGNVILDDPISEIVYCSCIWRIYHS